jgi:hypothetical protein
VKASEEMILFIESLSAGGTKIAATKKGNSGHCAVKKGPEVGSLAMMFAIHFTFSCTSWWLGGYLNKLD